MVLTYKQLRNKLENNNKIKDCVKIKKPPIINDGFPGQFNLSFTEHPLLKEYGKYIDFDHNYIFSTIVSCIRWSDIYDEKTKQSKLSDEESWKYLGVFEMGDIIGLPHLNGKRDMLKSQKEQVNGFFKFLDSLGIDKKDIYPSYQIGGNLNEITNGRYEFNFQVPSDEINKTLLLEQGIPEKNFIKDKTTDTLLCLSLKRRLKQGGAEKLVTPWGYRNEINVNIGSKNKVKLLDIGTFENFYWKPIKKNDKIEGLEKLDDTIAMGVVGLERLCMTVNNTNKIQNIDYLKQYYDYLGDKILGGESLRALHRIYTDIKNYNLTKPKSSSNIKRKMNRLKRNVIDSGIQLDKIKDLLTINAENQPWHPELIENIDCILQEIKEYTKRRT